MILRKLVQLGLNLVACISLLRTQLITTLSIKFGSLCQLLIQLFLVDYRTNGTGARVGGRAEHGGGTEGADARRVPTLATCAATSGSAHCAPACPLRVRAPAGDWQGTAPRGPLRHLQASSGHPQAQRDMRQARETRFAASVVESGIRKYFYTTKDITKATSHSRGRDECRAIHKEFPRGRKLLCLS